MDVHPLTTALRRYHARYDNDVYKRVTHGLEERHAVHLGCACQDIALGLCGYKVPDLEEAFRLIRRESRKRRRLAAQFLRRFKGAL